MNCNKGDMEIFCEKTIQEVKNINNRLVIVRY